MTKVIKEEFKIYPKEIKKKTTKKTRINQQIP